MRSILYPATAIIALSGCNSSALQFRPTMGSDRVALGMEAVAYLNELQAAYEKKDDANCFMGGALPSRQNVESEAFQRLKKATETDRAAVARLGCVRFKENAVAGDFKRHLDAGLSLADLYCDDYFRRIAVRKQTRQFGRSTTNDVGTAASVGLGLASAGSVVTGGAGALFGLADGIFRNYDTAFVVEPDLGKMLKLVRTAQGSLRDSFKKDPPASYPETNAAIVSYAQLCSYAGMDNLLNAALEEGSKPETIEEAVARFQTTAGKMDRPDEVKKAEALEAEVAGLKRQKAAIDEKKTLEDAIRKAQTPAQPAAPGTPPGN